MTIDDNELETLIGQAFELEFREAVKSYPAKSAIYETLCPQRPTRQELKQYLNDPSFVDRAAVADHVDRFGCCLCRYRITAIQVFAGLAAVAEAAVNVFRFPWSLEGAIPGHSANEEQEAWKEEFPYPELDLEVTLYQEEDGCIDIEVRSPRTDLIGYTAEVLIALPDTDLTVSVLLTAQQDSRCSGFAVLGEMSELKRYHRFFRPEVRLHEPSNDE